MAPGERGRASSTPDPLVGQLIGGKYRVIGLLARGGMGRIYRAEQEPLGRIVALKVLHPKPAGADGDTLDPQFQKRFLREAATCARLKHPNTVTVYDYGQIEGEGEPAFFMAMEYVEGRTLTRALKEDGPFTPARALLIAREITRSLREAHRLGIVHRDLKPSNVMLCATDEGETAKVLDFGIAKLVQEDQENITLDDRIVGSPRYMAPEQIRQESVDGRADLYSLGVLLYEMLAGLPPFDGEGAVKALMAHLTTEVPSISERSGREVPTEVEALVLRCLEKQAADRFQDAEALKRAIGDVLARLGEAADSSFDVPVGRMLDTEEVPRARRDVGGANDPTVDLEAPEDPPARWSPLPWVLLGVLLLLASGGTVAAGVAMWMAGDAQAPVAVVEPVLDVPEPAPPPEAPPPTPAKLHLVSAPPGAEVWEGTRLHGVTPISLEAPLAGEDPRAFELRLEGHQPYELTQGTAEADLTYEAALQAIRAPAPRPPRAPRPDPTPQVPEFDDIQTAR